MPKNEDLIMLYQKTNDEKYLLQLININRGLINRCCRRYQKYEEEDVRQEAQLFMIQTARDYKPDSNILFTTQYVNGFHWYMINDYIKTQSSFKISEEAVNLLRKYRKYIYEYSTNGKNTPSDGEIIKYLGISKKRLARLKYYDSIIDNVASLDVVTDEDGEESTLIDMLGDEDGNLTNTVDRIVFDDLKRALWSEIDELPPNWKRDIVAYFKHGKSMQQIADENGITRSAVSNHVQYGLDRLRSKPSTMRKLKALSEEVFTE